MPAGQAEVKIWEDLTRMPTPEETAAHRAQIAAFGDIAFQAEVARQMGPYGRSAISEQHYQYVPTKDSYNLQGFYNPKSTVAPPGSIYEAALAAAGMGPELRPDTAYVIGPLAASRATTSHEFRHRAGVRTESTNRRWDAWRADNPRDFDAAARALYPSQSLANARKLLMEELTQNFDRYMAAESEAARAQHMAVPNFRNIWQQLAAMFTPAYVGDYNEFFAQQARQRQSFWADYAESD